MSTFSLGSVPERKYLPRGELLHSPGALGFNYSCSRFLFFVLLLLPRRCPWPWGRVPVSAETLAMEELVLAKRLPPGHFPDGWVKHPPGLFFSEKKLVHLSTHFHQNGGWGVACRYREQIGGYQAWGRAWVKWVKGIKRYKFGVTLKRVVGTKCAAWWRHRQTSGILRVCLQAAAMKQVVILLLVDGLK